MRNPNALIAMALISQNTENPYSIFCEYIKYCIFTNTEDTMTLANIREAVSNEFGLSLPYNITLKCLSYICEQGEILWDNHQIKRTGSFDVAGFEQARTDYRVIEDSLINAFVKYVGKYGREWSSEYAREQLIRVLDRNGLAYDIFLHSQVQGNGEFQLNIKEIEESLADDDAIQGDAAEKQPLFSDSFFAGRFIQETLETENLQKEYLQKICEGLMLCVGTYQLPTTNAEQASVQINGTDFFFDTRLLLRFIGCAGEAAVDAVKELVKLIQSQGGTICYYPQTLEEMERALDEAIYSLSCGYPPRDEEMRLYAAKIRNNTSLMSAKKANLQSELAKSNIKLKPRECFSEMDRITFGFDPYDLQHYMESKLSWEKKTIENDALSIWETHMRRQGNYDAYFGSQSRLPVFVTSNSRLIGIALQFREARKSARSVSRWNANRLPVITDIRLTCRLWSPASDSERLSLLYLTANAVAAQRPTKRYLDTIRKYALDLEKNTPEYSGIPLPSFFDDTVTTVVLKNTQGLEENLDIGSFANSIAELAEWKAREQEVITKRIESERDQTAERLNKQTADIIEGAVDDKKNKLGWRLGMLLWLILNWPIFIGIVCAGIGGLVSIASGSWKPLLFVAVPVVLKVVEYIISSDWIVKQLLRRSLPLIERAYEIKIAKNLRKAEKDYAERIFERAKQETALIKKARLTLEK